MNVTPDALAHRLGAGLSPALATDERLRTLALELGREVLDYGISVLPREMFRGRSGAEVAAMVAEDIEAAIWMKPLLRAREVERIVPVAAKEIEDEDDGDTDAPPAPTTETVIEKIPPRIVEFGRGWGIVGFVLAVLYPEQTFELVDPSRQRAWWWRRLTNLHGTKNFRVHLVDHQEFVANNAQSLDIAITKRYSPYDSLTVAVPAVREGGRILSFQSEDRAAEIRVPHFNDEGVRVRLETTLDFESPAARRHQLLCIGVGTTAKDGRKSAA